MNKIAVIGANGFIGKRLIERLLKSDEAIVTAYGRQDSGHIPNYRKFDQSFPKSLSDDLASKDFIYYLISESIPATSWHNPIFEVERNLLPFLQFLGSLKNLNQKKIIFVSSGGTVYGPTSGKVNEHAPTHPFSPYGIIKLCMENFLEYYRVKDGLNYDIFRVSNVYGEGQNTKKGLGIINTFLERIITDGEVEVYGDGSATRNYIYIEDVCELLALSLRLKNRSEVFNLSSDTTLSINELLEVLRSGTTSSFKVKYREARTSDNSFIDLDNSKILDHFPEFRFTPIEEGIKKTYTYLRKQYNG